MARLLPKVGAAADADAPKAMKPPSDRFTALSRQSYR
jgi:hypothetical protein